MLTVRQCVEAGLVDGTKVHLDGSLIDADASRDSVVKADAIATATTPGDVAEPSQTLPLVAQHEDNTGREAAATVADREFVGGMVRNICFANARDYFRMELDPAYAATKQRPVPA